MTARPRLLLLYHFFHPDEVAGSRLFADLAREMSARGFDVTVLTSNRVYGDPTPVLPAVEQWEGVTIVRSYRPAWNQGRPLSRLMNTAWLLAAWRWRARTLSAPDAVVVGTDPAFAPLLLPSLRHLWPDARRLLWCFDLYPEAIEAEGQALPGRWLAPIARRLMRTAYAAAHVVADLGPGMAGRLADYDVRSVTLTPWAIAEPAVPLEADAHVRAELFGGAPLGLLYSGTLGRAHDFAAFLALARHCESQAPGRVAFCFSGRGHRFDELRGALTPLDHNVRLAGFCPEHDLQARLAAADMHLVSLRSAWSGVVVPSKFFASLAAGRPVVFAGPRDSDIAAYVQHHDVGLAFEPGAEAGLVGTLLDLAGDPGRLRDWKARARRSYDDAFSRRAVCDRWAEVLKQQMSTP